MTRPLFRLLGDDANSPEEIPTVNSDLVVIIAALLCALICVLGLIVVARCAWLRRLTSRSSTDQSIPPPQPPPAKGLKKKVIRALPKVTYTTESTTKFTECAICLAEFTAGNEIRVLPQCGHGFHATCVDTWLAAHSSCPSCRQILVVTRCEKCGGLAKHKEGRSKEREGEEVRCSI